MQHQVVFFFFSPRVIAIGIGSGFNKTELKLIASEPIEDNMFLAKNFDAALDAIVDSIFVTTCTGTSNIRSIVQLWNKTG